jgi:hypothetical protein
MIKEMPSKNLYRQVKLKIKLITDNIKEQYQNGSFVKPTEIAQEHLYLP